MKRIIIPFVAAFGLSLGIATGVVMMRAPKALPSVAGSPVKGAAKSADSTSAVKDSVVARGSDSSTTMDSTRSTNSAASVKTGVAVATPATATKAEVGPAPKSQQTSAVKATPTTTVAATAGAARKTGPRPPRPITDSLIGRRLAQVFAAMQPKDAARVLEQMDDSDVRAILGSLSSKQQAAILGSFPTQRAALIVQTTLRTASSGGTE